MHILKDFLPYLEEKSLELTGSEQLLGSDEMLSILYNLVETSYSHISMKVGPCLSCPH